MERITLTEHIPQIGSYDIIVAGGGVAGIAAALAAAREGKQVLLIEKTITLGGLATIGLVNLFVPMCNGRGVQIIKGMADEFLKLSTKYSWHTVPEIWQKGEPGYKATNVRLICRYSPNILIWQFTDLLHRAGVNLMFDTVVTAPVMENRHCKGIIIENKSGRQYLEAKMFVDTTGDCDILRRAGVPTLLRKNFHTYYAYGATLDSCKKASADSNIASLYTKGFGGGEANLYGGHHPENIEMYDGTDAADINRYVITNQLEALANLRPADAAIRDVIQIPTMPQFRTTRCIDGDYIFREEDKYTHFEDSVSAICDFDRRDYLYEVPYRVLVKTGFDNLITAGRSAAAEGYGWDILRVIPPAIVTGQAAGLAACQAIDANDPIYAIDVTLLQRKLEAQNVMIHFDDSLIHTGEDAGGAEDFGHI